MNKFSSTKNKTIFITGASSGIGREVSKNFLRNGWNVIATARRLNLLKSIKLNKNDINICNKYKFKYNIPDDLNNDGNESEDDIDDILEDDSDGEVEEEEGDDVEVESDDV